MGMHYIFSGVHDRKGLGGNGACGGKKLPDMKKGQLKKGVFGANGAWTLERATIKARKKQWPASSSKEIVASSGKSCDIKAPKQHREKIQGPRLMKRETR